MIEYAKIIYRKLNGYHKLTKYITPMSADTLYGTCVGIGTQDIRSKTMYYVEDSYTINTYAGTVSGRN